MAPPISSRARSLPSSPAPGRDGASMMAGARRSPELARAAVRRVAVLVALVGLVLVGAGDRAGATPPVVPDRLLAVGPVTPDAAGVIPTPTIAVPTPLPPGGPPAPEDAGRGPGPLVLVAIALLGLLAGTVLGLLLGRRGRPAPASGATAAGPTAASLPPPGDPAHRATLVAAVIEGRDQITSEALRDRLGLALAEVGVTELRADGVTFDPRLHVAVDQVPTADPALDGVIATTERPGYTDGGHTVRLPEVIVHRVRP